MLIDPSKLRERWKLTASNQAAEAASWDAAAGEFGRRPIPGAADSDFLRLLEREGMQHPDARVLDVGCGAGTYAAALSPRVGSVTGLDLSPGMIGEARRRMKELELWNLRFDVADWEAVDIGEAGFYKAFDLVFARMTPAVGSFEGFQKLSDCSRGWCVMTKPVKRFDALQQGISALLGIPDRPPSGEKDVLYGFSLLYAQEKYPRIEYGHRRDQVRRPLDKTIEIYLNRARSAMELTAEQERKITDYISGAARDGFVESLMDMTTATLYWRVGPEELRWTKEEKG